MKNMDGKAGRWVVAATVLVGLVFGGIAKADVPAGSNAVTNVWAEVMAGGVSTNGAPSFLKKDVGWFRTHEKQFEEAAKQKVRVAMLGDSLTAGWSQTSWSNHWAPRGAFNFGIPADRTEHVLWRIRQGLFDRIDPDVVMLEIGTNDIKSGDIRRSPKEVFDAIRMIVEEIRAAEPKARIIVMAILPRQPDKYEWIDAVILETNARLSQLQRDIPNVLVVDIGIQYRGPNGKAAKIHLQNDMLHLKNSGYNVWTQCVIDLVDAGLAKGKGGDGDKTGAQPATEGK